MTELTHSDAILEQYVRQYNYYEKNLRYYPTETIYISFENFIEAPLRVFTKLVESIGKHIKGSYILSPTDDTPLPNAIGGNLKAYLSCNDFPLDDDKENLSHGIRPIVERFCFDLSSQHNRVYADRLIKYYGTHIQYSDAAKREIGKNNPLQNVNIPTRRIVESLYKHLINKATNC